MKTMAGCGPCRAMALALVLALLGLPVVCAHADEDAGYEASHVNMYRLYNPNSGEHFYTADMFEATSVAGAGWQWEGVGWVAPLTGDAVYRLYNPNAGDHHYTTDAAERNALIALGWSNEGIGWRSDTEGHTAVLRQYNPNAVAGSHNFTVSWVENDSLVGAGWSHEGVAWYATNGPALAVQARWLVTSAWGSLERYWIGADGSIARGRFVEAEEGAGYTAYARPDGAIVRGKWDDGAGHVYVADDEGRLASTADGASGWIVSSAYGDGMQRYYYDADAHAMHTGFFWVDGSYYYGVGDKGYVARNRLVRDGATWYRADNDGKLTETSVPVDIVDAIDMSFAHGPKDAAHQKYIVLHDTEGGGDPMSVIDGWRASGTYVASHFVVGRDGTVVQCVPLDQIAHHAGFAYRGTNDAFGVADDGRDDMRGTSRLGGGYVDYGMNAWSIGIEMVHWDNVAYTQAQLDALDGLIAYIDAYYGFESAITDHKAWNGNSDTSPAFAGYLANYQAHRTHVG